MHNIEQGGMQGEPESGGKQPRHSTAYKIHKQNFIAPKSFPRVSLLLRAFLRVHFGNEK